MKIVLAKNSGFCGGVFRAFNLVEKKINNRNSNGFQIYILGSLAHNNSVVKKIQQWQIKKIKSLRNIKKGDTVIITAHGVSEKNLEDIKSKGGKVFDTTCPKVSRIHKLVKKYEKKSFKIIILGDKEHKEVEGIDGWCGNSAIIITSISDAKKLIAKIENKEIKSKKFLLVSQTTQNIKNFKKIRELFEGVGKKNNVEVKIFDTICRASYLRQEEAEKIAIKNDFVIILGGKESANTKRLWQTAKKVNPKIFWIGEMEKINQEKVLSLVRNSRSVGVITGASTPRWEIDELRRVLKKST